MRTPGGSQNDFIQAIGGQPVAIGFPEVYSALERGVVDCAVTGTATGNGARWYEVTKHLYTLPVQWGVAAYGVNLAWWNKLDAPVRDFLQKIMTEVQEKQWALGLELTEDGIACNAGLTRRAEMPEWLLACRHRQRSSYSAQADHRRGIA